MSTSFKNVTPTGPGGTATLLIVLSFTGFLLLTQSLFVVPSGQVAVVTTLGKVSGPSRRAGLNFKIPFVQSVYPFDIKTQVQPEKFETLTKDLQVIRATATVKYSVKPNEAGRIFATIASRNSDVYQKIVQPSLLKALKSVFSQYELETIATEFNVISEKRVSYPKYVIINVYFPGFTFEILYIPLMSVALPIDVPFKITLQKIIGSPLSLS